MPAPGQNPGPTRPLPGKDHAIEPAQRARHAADRIAERLHAPPPAGAPTSSLTGDGAVGVALLHIERAAADGDWEPAHRWLSAAAAGGLDADAGSGLYHGAPAFAFALHPSPHPGYAAARALTDDGVATLTRSKLQQASRRLRYGRRPPVCEYDLISGLTGMGAHLRRHDPEGGLLTDVLAYLVRLTQPLDGLPGWWTPDPPRRDASHPPGGCSNHGLAHGIAVIFRVKSLMPGSALALG